MLGCCSSDPWLFICILLNATLNIAFCVRKILIVWDFYTNFPFSWSSLLHGFCRLSPQYLNLSDNAAVTSRTLHLLADTCPLLTSLNLLNCNYILGINPVQVIGCISGPFLGHRLKAETPAAKKGCFSQIFVCLTVSNSLFWLRYPYDIWKIMHFEYQILLLLDYSPRSHPERGTPET